jgi:DMSO/TMAO reductase YedYZ heme-binding membrane subunit
MLIMVVLVARLPWLEASVGQDRLISWHRRVAPWAFGLIAAHVVLITLGYAQAAHVGVLRQLWVFVTSYPDLLAAIAGFGLLVMAGVTSIRLARRRLRYETWWVVHLYVYLGLALAFAHQIVTGVPFIGHPLTRAVWIVVWACTAGMVIVFRVAQPIWELYCRDPLAVAYGAALVTSGRWHSDQGRTPAFSPPRLAPPGRCARDSCR